MDSDASSVCRAGKRAGADELTASARRPKTKISNPRRPCARVVSKYCPDIGSAICAFEILNLESPIAAGRMGARPLNPLQISNLQSARFGISNLRSAHFEISNLESPIAARRVRASPSKLAGSSPAPAPPGDSSLCLEALRKANTDVLYDTYTVLGDDLSGDNLSWR